MPLVSRRHVLGLGLAAAGTAVLPVGQSTAAVSAKRQAKAAAIASTFMDKYGVPGFSVAYGRGADMLYVGSFGTAYLGTGEVLSPEHRFRIASISKPITATAIMLLRERGQLVMGDKVFGEGGVLNARFPLPDAAPHRDWLEAITIDHLLTHSCGGWTNDGRDPMFMDPGVSQDELIATTLRNAPLVNPPGKAYAYSNFGYCLLGRVIEVLGGVAYADFVQANVLVPCGITDMEIGGSTIAERRPLEVAYASNNGNPYDMNIARMDSHGGWIATAADLVRFCTHIDGYKSARDIISASSVKLMATPGASTGYGHGWGINPNHSNRWHAGSLPGTATELIRVSGGVSMAGLCNTRFANGLDTNEGLDRVLWDIYGQVAA